MDQSREPTSPPTSELPGASAHLRGLDGLRAIAVLAVVAFHVIPTVLPGGGLGVDIFFVISGFLITGLLFGERASGRIRLRSFWARRARRLLPALVILVVVCSSAALFIGGDVLVGLGREVLGAATFSSNWLAIANGSSYFSGSTPDLFRNLWSLAVEEQFYLVWPFVVLLVFLLRSRWARFSVFVAVAAVSAVEMFLLYSPKIDPTRVYYGTDTHSFGLALGAALAVATSGMATRPLAWPAWARRALPVVGTLALAGLIAIAVLIPSDAAPTFQGGLAVVAVLTSLTILGAIAPGSFLGLALDVAPLGWTGKRSYGIYLWHWPVLVLALAAAPALQNSPATTWLPGVLTVVITVAAAALSYRFVERPIHRLGFRAWVSSAWRRDAAAGSSPAATHEKGVVPDHAARPTHGRNAPRVVVAALAALALVAGVGGTATAIIHAPSMVSAQSDVDAGIVALAKAKYLPPPPPGAPGSNIDAVGDSVMLASAPELLQVYPGMHIDAVVSRQMKTLPGIVQTLIDEGQLRQILVVALGTNGSIGISTLEQVHAMIGPNRQMVVVNVEEPRPWEGEVNTTLAQFASENSGNVALSDWYDAIKPHISVLARDQIHPGGAGGRIYTAALQAALGRLAAIPPYPNVSDFFSTIPLSHFPGNH